MKKKVLIISLCLIVVLVLVLVLVLNKKENKSFEVIYGVQYVGDDGWACLTFHDENDYSLYDCDSEPTRYFFDTEADCSFKLNGEYLVFDCKYNYYNYKDNKIKILNWTEKEFKFEYDGEVKTFKGHSVKKETVSSIKLGEEQYIEQLKNVPIENSNDYIKITKRVKWDMPEADEDTISVYMEIPYVISVDGIEYKGIYKLDESEKGTADDQNPKYDMQIIDLTVDYDIKVLVNEK